MELRTVNVTRYIMPLREGGSLPALAEADDSFKYVVKFRGAGHGTKALIAELIGGEVAFLSGALPFDPVVTEVDEKLASQVVWLDALLTNVDRTVKNTNMLMWHKELWLIDHGASLFFHHSWVNWHKHALSSFTQVKDHALLPLASKLDEVDAEFRKLLTSEKIREIVDLIPDSWIEWRDKDETPQDIRDIYYRFLKERIEHSEIFVKEAQHARKAYL